MTPGETRGTLAILGGRVRYDVIAVVLCVAFTFLSWTAMRIMGTVGLVLVTGGLLGAIVTVYLLIRHPVAICAIWFLAMSGLQTQGMIRMPGLPDFSLARLFLVLVVVMTPLGIIAGRAVLKPPYSPDILIIMHATYVFLNMYLVSTDPRLNTWLASSFAPVAAYFLAKQYVVEERQLRFFCIFFTLCSVYFWVTAIAEKFGLDALVWPKSIINRDIGHSWYGRSRGPFLQPALTGQILGWYMMVQVYLLTRKISPLIKLLLMVNIGLCGLGVLFTYTRGAWVATAAGFVAMAVLRPRYRYIFIGVGVAAVAMLLLGVLNPSEDEFLEERIGTTNTIDNRLGFLAAASRMIEDKPLFGVGYFRYMDLAPLYNKGTNIPLYGFVKKGAGENVAIHDIYIGRAAEEGLVSLVIFLALLVVIAKQYLNRWRKVAQVGGGQWYDLDFIGMAAGIAASYVVGGMTIDFRYFDLINVLPLFFSAIVIFFPVSSFAPSQPVLPVGYRSQTPTIDTGTVGHA